MSDACGDDLGIRFCRSVNLPVFAVYGNGCCNASVADRGGTGTDGPDVDYSPTVKANAKWTETRSDAGDPCVSDAEWTDSGVWGAIRTGNARILNFKI